MKTLECLDIVFECDRKECETCHSECSHTSNIVHAKNLSTNDKICLSRCLYYLNKNFDNLGLAVDNKGNEKFELRERGKENESK